METNISSSIRSGFSLFPLLVLIVLWQLNPLSQSAVEWELSGLMQLISPDWGNLPCGTCLSSANAPLSYPLGTPHIQQAPWGVSTHLQSHQVLWWEEHVGCGCHHQCSSHGFVLCHSVKWVSILRFPQVGLSFACRPGTARKPSALNAYIISLSIWGNRFFWFSSRLPMNKFVLK